VVDLYCEVTIGYDPKVRRRPGNRVDSRYLILDGPCGAPPPPRVISDCHPSEGELKTNRAYGLSISGFYF
jgi:hypothetical protein